MKYFVFFITYFAILICLAGTSSAQQRKRTSVPTCSFSDYKFRCPKGLRTITRDPAKKIFLARRIEKDYTYAVFVLDGNATSDVESTIEKDFLPKLFPKLKKEFTWREAELMTDGPMSDFELSRKFRIGFDGDGLMSYAYRELKQGERRFYVGSVWKEKLSSAESKKSFDDTQISTEGGCFEVLDIIRAITQEKAIKENPCEVSITMTGDPN